MSLEVLPSLEVGPLLWPILRLSCDGLTAVWSASLPNLSFVGGDVLHMLLN